jgi:hypothetical protein
MDVQNRLRLHKNDYISVRLRNIDYPNGAYPVYGGKAASGADLPPKFLAQVLAAAQPI